LVGLGFGEAKSTIPLFPFSALLEEVNALKAL
jgi:hypothetical protein